MKKLILSITSLAMTLSVMALAHKGHLAQPLEDTAWACSQWISVVDAPVVTEPCRDGMRAADGANWFVADITNAKPVAKAEWMTAALGVYDLYVNGELIGEEVLKPGFTHYEKTKISYTYDVTDAIDTKAGAQNQLAVQVTPGWWADKIITPERHDGMIGKKCAFRGVLQLTYSDGTTQLFGSDTEAWKAGIAGKVKHAAIYDGEDYDNREAEGYLSVEKMSAPEINAEFNGEIVPTCGAEVYMRPDLAMSPIEAYVWSAAEGATDDEYGTVTILRRYDAGEPMTLHAGEKLVVDFGQNCAGVPSFVFNAPAGTMLTCLPGELLNDGNGAKKRGMDGPEGSVHRLNLRSHRQNFILNYTFADSDEPVEFTPRSTFFGYRFASIEATGDVVITSLQSVPVSSIAQGIEIGKITTGNELVNKLISNTLWGQRSNYLSVPTDCPQRNERLGWTADTQVFAAAGSFFANTAPFFHKWMRDMRDSQDPLGGFPGVAPLAQYGNEMNRLGWSDAGVIVPWTVWKQFADTDIVDESWESMERYMDHIAPTNYDHTAHAAENGNYQWADWLSYEPLESCGGGAFGPNGPLPEAIEYWNYLSGCYLISNAEMMRDMAAHTGRDADKYASIAADARKYVSERFINADGTFKTDILNTMQTPALFALRNGLVSGEARDNMIERLRQNFAEHDNCLQTGFLGTSILMGTLTDCGMADVAYELLFQRKNPSWLYSIDNGATTIWERWNSYMKEHGMGPRGMNSFNHYAYGCVCEWIWGTVAGIASDAAEPGFKHIIMKPVPDKRLGTLDAEYASAAGLIKSSWHYEGDTWHWTFTIPEGAYASVTLPGSSEAVDYPAGTHKVVVKL